MEMVDSSYSWAGVGSALASLIFLWSMVQHYIPFQLEDYLSNLGRKIVAFVSPYVTISIHEYTSEAFGRSEAYTAAEAYLSASCGGHARKVKAELGKGSDRLPVGIDDHEEVVDEFHGAKLWWYASKNLPRTNVISWYPGEEDRRTYRLTFHKRQRKLVEGLYLPHVLGEGRAVAVKNRQRRLFTNNPSSNWYGYDKCVWGHVKLEHPSTFDTLGMDPARKQDIIDDRDVFRDGKEYYAKVGKVWKRGYLLYGPPGNGKSTMIAAMANFLDYDVYDLELTTVMSNTELRKLFIETTGKSIIVIEDIDCSLDLTGKLKHMKKVNKGKKGKKDIKKTPMKEEKEENSKMTLSGLLNFIDGLWSACGGERIIVFSPNHIEKLDPALIRRGRMDKRIEMSYCSFEAFKVLAKNYLGVEEHHLYDDIQRLLGEVNMTPAGVAENLMPKSKKKDVDACLESLVEVLKVAKEEALAKALEGKKEEEDEDDNGDEEHEEEEKEKEEKKIGKKEIC